MTNVSSELVFPFVTINAASKLGGAEYPFVPAEASWEIVTYRLDLEEADRELHPHSEDEPTLRWVKDNKVVELFVWDETRVWSTGTYLENMGLQLRVSKSAFVTSKRISRIMRPYFVHGRFGLDEIKIKHLNQDEREAKVWDGAGLINRRTLLRLIDQLPADLSRAKRKTVIGKLHNISRVEFTLLSPNGQEKGHAMVVDDDTMTEDFVLPQDAKSDTVLLNEIFVGINLSFKAKDHMLIDAQSLINLYPFIDETHLKTWLHQEGQMFINGIENGEMREAMSHIDSEQTLASVTNWHVLEYIASGGDPLWFRGIVKAIMKQHLTRIDRTLRGNQRFPVPGGAFYVMPAGVGMAAGYNIEVRPGYVQLDKTRNAAWVNNDDWVNFIADVLGGADNDDALWVFPFTDTVDGEKKIVLWRSPNQLGEYIVMRPTSDSYEISWNGEISWPEHDSSLLATRKDRMNINYLNNYVVPAQTIEPHDYQLSSMDVAINQAQANVGGLGMYCNVLMLAKALLNRLPNRPCAELEDVIDATVKTGDDISKVKDWCYWAGHQMLKMQLPVPAMISERLQGLVGKDTFIPLSEDHWMDRLSATLTAHQEFITKETERLMDMCAAPAEVLRIALPHETDGIYLVKQYNNFISNIIRSGRKPTEPDFETVREKTQQLINQSDDPHSLLLGALVHCQRHHKNESVVWQMAGNDDKPAISSLTIAALRETGVLNEIAETQHGLVRYPGAIVRESSLVSVKLSGVWYNYLKATDADRYAQLNMGEIDREVRDQTKAKVREWVMTGFFNERTLQLGMVGERKVVLSPKGNVLAYVPVSQENLVNDSITIVMANEDDGNLMAIVR